jgi:hypothetical protein
MINISKCDILFFMIKNKKEAVSKGRPLFLPVDLNVEKERAAEATLS